MQFKYVQRRFIKYVQFYICRLLGELHIELITVCRKKALARSFIWWPGPDKAIEEIAVHSEPCKTTIAMSKPVAQHPWQLPNPPCMAKNPC